MATQLLLGLMAVSVALGISNVDMSNKSATQEVKYVAKITDDARSKSKTQQWIKTGQDMANKFAGQ